MSHHTRAIPRSVRAGTQFVRLPALLALAVGSATAAHAQASELDFGVLAGHWTDERIVERWGLDTACHNEPLWVHPDGLLVAWDARYGAPEVRAEVQCAADGSCSLLSAPDRQPPGLRLTADAGRLAFCTGAECIPPTSARGPHVPPNLLGRRLRAAARPAGTPAALARAGPVCRSAWRPRVVDTGRTCWRPCFADPAAVGRTASRIGLGAAGDRKRGVQYEVI